MKKFIRLISALLSAIMLISSFVALSTIEVSAAENEKTTEDKLKEYLTKSYSTPEEKLATMQLMLDKDGYQLWVDTMSGETACLDKASGQILFSNPYDIASSKGSASTKEQIMSQIFVKYTDNGNPKTFYSFVEAAYRGQIVVKNIKGGIRIEYTIGREETRMLVPRVIRKERFESMILDVAYQQVLEGNLLEFTYKKLKAYYLEKDPDSLTSERMKTELYAAFPITKKMAVYVFDPTASETELRKIEEIIKTYCPLYTYEELDRDHEETEYVGSDRAPALFKMALEYTLDENGMTVRLPANGIRFDESEYQLNYISILPYMGAGANYAGSDKNKTQTGYTFYPDGSGSIFRFEELADKGTTTISGNVYGPDFAYQTITGAHQEVIRYPAFGLVSNEIRTETIKETDEKTNTTVNKTVEKTVDRGYVAVIEEGDSMAQIYTYHAGSLSKYNTMQMMFYPRPTDSYNMKDAISVGSNSEVTVVSERKYVGNYKIRYFMLTDDEIAKENNIQNYYETSWLGMAVAYREYLDKQGVLTRLTESDVKDDIPLYIETFGAIPTVEKILSIPVNTKVALTSFEDIATMYDKLAGDGITNINFKLTGYANGGMYSTVPYKLKWEKSVGGASGFEDLVAYAKEKGFGVYPDFDFAYAQNFDYFDGMSTSKHLVKTIDNRYTSRREYSATYQTFVSYYQLAISPAYFSHFYEKFTKNYLKYGLGNISVSTLGTDLNSDFDEDEPYNREDSKQYTAKAMEFFADNYDSVMVDGGNAYTWKYVDHILGVSLDSSRYNRSSNSVPFLGVLLHGYINIAGSALNMEGNVGYAKLRTMENGASPYFILSYDNTTLLKESSYLSKYYSVRFDIWYDELVEIYNELNDVLADVQTKLIISHEFLVGERVPDEDELEADILAAEKELKEALAKAELTAQSQRVKDILAARQTAKNNATRIAALLEGTMTNAADAKASIAKIEEALVAVPEAKAAYDAAVEAEAEAKAASTAATQAKTAANTALSEAKKGTDTAAIEAAQATYDAALAAETEAKAAYTAAQAATKTAKSTYDTADKALTAALSEGTKASTTAVANAAEAAALAEAAVNAAILVNAVDDATDAIKKAATEYADAATKDAAEVVKYAAEAENYAAVAVAISADKTIAALISTAEKAATDAQTRANDVNLYVTDATTGEVTMTGKYANVLKALANKEEAAAAVAEAEEAYKTAQDVYAEAKAKAESADATAADRTALSEAGVAMNNAKAELETAQKTATSKNTAYTSSITALRTSLQKVLDERKKAEKAADATNEAVEAASQAVEALKKMEGISELLVEAATSSLETAKANAVGINAAVATATEIYATAADLVKDYVIIIEEPEPEPEPEVKPETPTEDDENENETPVEDEEENTGNQLYSDYEYTKYTNDNGNIVKVTYGDSDGKGGYIPYKTFILNYNFFDVKVVLDGVTYTIPESGYVVFYH